MNSVGEITAPCRTPFFICLVLDLGLSDSMCACLRVIKFESHFLQLGWRSVVRILEIKIEIGTVSKALDIFIAATMERGAGSLLLKPPRIF